MGFQIRVEYLQIVHYYYFFAGVLSLLAVFLTWASLPIYGIAFIMLNFLHFALSFYVSWVILARLKRYIIIDMKRYTAEHIAVTVFTMGLAAFMFSFVNRAAFINYILSIDIFVFVLGASWYLLSRTKTVRKTFSLHLPANLQKAKREAISLGDKYGFEIPAEFEAYKPGEDQEIDSILRLMVSPEGRAKLFWVARELYITIYSKKRRQVEKWLSSGEYSGKEMAEFEKIRKKYEGLEEEAGRKEPD